MVNNISTTSRGDFMKILGCVVALLLVLSLVGCAKPAVTPSTPATPTTPTEQPATPTTTDTEAPATTDTEAPATTEDGTKTAVVLEGDIELNRNLGTPTDIVSINPIDVKISTGTTVNWVNTDDRPHVLSSYGGDFTIPGMKSLRVAPGESWSFTFEEVGTYKYIDTVYGTWGTIVVE
jgi:plastocyanin